MSFVVSTLSVDLLSDRATVALGKNEDGKHYSVHINVPIVTPGNQPEHRLQQIAKAAAKQALLDAANAL